MSTLFTKSAELVKASELVEKIVIQYSTKPTLNNLAGLENSYSEYGVMIKQTITEILTDTMQSPTERMSTSFGLLRADEEQRIKLLSRLTHVEPERFIRLYCDEFKKDIEDIEVDQFNEEAIEQITQSFADPYFHSLNIDINEFRDSDQIQRRMAKIKQREEQKIRAFNVTKMLGASIVGGLSAGFVVSRWSQQKHFKN